MDKVTQADRDAAAKFPYIPEQTHLLQAFAAHREAGRRAGLEEAAKKCPARHSMLGCPMSAKIGDGHD